MNPLELLARSELFDGAAAGDFEPIARSAVTRHYGRGELIWGTGDRADAMYLILSGEISVSRIGPQGDEYVVEAYVAGDVLGMLHFFERPPIRQLDARAVSPTACWVVPQAEVMRLLEGSPKLMSLMLRTYSRWIVQRDLLGADASFRNLTARVATRLLHLADRYGERSEDGVQINLHVTETTLAGMLGASRENVSRAIAQLQRAGAVRRERGILVLPEPDQLRIRYSWLTEEDARSIATERRGLPPEPSASE